MITIHFKVGAVASGRQSGVSRTSADKQSAKLSEDLDSQIYGYAQNRYSMTCSYLLSAVNVIIGLDVSKKQLSKCSGYFGAVLYV